MKNKGSLGRIRNAVLSASVFVYVLLNLIFVPLPVLAASSTKDRLLNKLHDLGETQIDFKEATEDSLPQTVGGIIQTLLSFLGVVFLGLVLYAGWLWFRSGDDEEKAKKAMDILRQGVIGLIIISLAYAITSFVTNEIFKGAGGL